ncbi:uncharacterized protein LOC110117055 [Athalia rosae]|uniref:uncharacterized protein LOC110117055 n=1 Tax=Athalia rosae TaxID=37344 RepID=UPI002033C80A|nr:uncharacterized protein LOC110117055 [Athalia rosae]
MKHIFGGPNFFKYSKQIVYYCIKIVGLAPFEFRENRFHRPDWFGSLYPFSIIAGGFFALFEHLKVTRTGDFSVQMRRILNIFSSILPTVLNILFFSILRDKFISLLNDLCEFNRAIEIAGITEDNEKYFKNIISFATPIIAVHSMIHAIVLPLNPRPSVFAAVGYFVDQTITLITILMFTNTMILMKNRFKLINEKLYDILKSPRCQKTSRISNVELGRLYPSEIRRNFTFNASGVSYSKHIRTIGGLHCDLHDLQIRAVDLLSLPISLISMKMINNIAFAIYNSFFIFTNWNTIMERKNLTNNWLYVMVLRPQIYAVIDIFELISIVYASVKTNREANATKTILIESWTNENLPESEKEILMFSMQLLGNDHSVSLFRFIAMDYSFIYKVLTSLIAYVILMIQLAEGSQKG